jgi:hypothetical protein
MQEPNHRSCSSHAQVAHKAGLQQERSASASAPAHCSATVCECRPQSTAHSNAPAHCKLRQLCSGFSESLDDTIHGTQQEILQTLSCKHANQLRRTDGTPGMRTATPCMRQARCACRGHTLHAALRGEGWSRLQLLAHPPHHRDNTAVCCFKRPLAPQHTSTAWVDLQDRQRCAEEPAHDLCERDIERKLRRVALSACMKSYRKVCMANVVAPAPAPAPHGH